MKKLIFTVALIMLMGCVKTVFLPDKEQPLSVVPKEWEKVVLKSVRGPDIYPVRRNSISTRKFSSIYFKKNPSEEIEGKKWKSSSLC